MSINLETAEKLAMCHNIVSFFLMLYRSTMKSQSPTKNPLSDDQPKEDLKTGIISGHVLWPFSCWQGGTYHLFATIQGLKAVSLSLSTTTCPSMLTT